MAQERWKIFICSIFFVLGFAVIFSLVGVLLQTVLVQSSASVQRWLGRVGGAIIILFGLYLVGLLSVPFLERKYTFKVRSFHSAYFTSFLFGAAFAVGWTPCV
ncbi:cytochrome C biogenesis protein, partial [Candidatus Woesearchaeota archaeon]|nr:cytochrome C biogenesis protein [Candidatus Woesearchaeota archaeon]